MGCGVVFLPRAPRGAFVAVVEGVVAVRPTIIKGFIAPGVVGDVLAVELADLGAPRWLVAPAVPVVVVFDMALAAPVAIFVVVLVLLGGLLLLLLPRLRRVHRQFLSQLLHRHRLLLYLILLVATCMLRALVTACKFFNRLLVLCIARWLVLNNLAGGVASVVLVAAHLSCD